MADTPGGWHPDPTGRYELRWFDGADWTAHVSTGGQSTTDPAWGREAAPFDPAATLAPASGVAPGGGGAATGGVGGRVESVATSTTVLTVLLGVAALASIFLGYTLFDRASLLSDGNLIELLDADDRVGTAFVIWLLAVAAAFGALVTWTFRVTRNVERLVPDPEVPSGMAIGAWFIPVANFYLPWKALQQGWRGAVSPAERPGWRSAPANPLVTAWWVLFCGGWVVFWITTALEPDETEALGSAIDRQQLYDRLGALSMLALVAAAGLAAVAVRQIRDRHAARVGEGSTG